MREFKSLNPEELPDTFDAEIHGEQPIVSVEESEGRITVQYTFPGFYLSDDTRDVEGETIPFEQVNIAETGFLGESGKPLLPSFGRYVQIPFDCDYTVSVKKSEPVQFDDLLVLPAQEMLTDSEEDEPFEYDKEFYAKDQFYPEDVVEVSGPFEIDGYNALLLHVRPLQYNPARKKLIGFSTITVTIDVSPKESEEYAFAHPDLDREAYGNLFLNPGRGIEERVRSGEEETTILRRRQEGPEFLIIYEDTFKKAAKKLAKWKNMRGLPTDVVSIAKVCSAIDKGSTVDKMKTYVRQKRRYSRLRYLLLLGDVEMISSQKIKDSPFGFNVTDYYCSTKRDPEHAEDFVVPWLSTGRIPAKTAEEGIAVVDKIIAYEKDPPENPEYYTRMVFAAYFEDKRPRDGKSDRAYLKTMEYIRKHMVTLGFHVEPIYVSSNPDMQEYNDGSPVPEEVKKFVVDKDTATKKLISATTKGYLLIGHRDHGAHTGWVHPPFRLYHLDEVKGKAVSMFYSINCLTGRFDLKSTRDSFAEKLLKIEGGAPSLIAATRPSHTWLNDSLIKALFDAMWAGVLPTFPGGTASYSVKYNRLGDILNYAKTYLPITLSRSNNFVKDHFEIYHVIGDPTLELWKAEPAKINLRATVNQGYLDIMSSICPKGSCLTIWYKDKMVKRIEPSSTHVRVSLRGTVLWPQSSGDITVCFWAPGCRFQQITVE